MWNHIVTLDSEAGRYLVGAGTKRMLVVPHEDSHLVSARDSGGERTGGRIASLTGGTEVLMRLGCSGSFQNS